MTSTEEDPLRPREGAWRSYYDLAIAGGSTPEEAIQQAVDAGYQRRNGRPSNNGRPPALPATDAEPFLETGQSGRQRFVAPRLGEHLANETPIATGGEALYVYRGGVYAPEGEADVRRRIAATLGDEWTRARADEVVKWLRDTAPTLWTTPPIDRINTSTGILELGASGVALRPHDPDVLSPIQIAARYDPSAECPRIDAFLEDALPGSEAIVHELAGYLATPDNRYQRAIMCLGAGGGGKSTLLSLLSAFLGRWNVSAVSLHQLDEDRFATADLYGRLANVFADLNARALRDSSIFKSITGGDEIRGERKNRPAFKFLPYSRLLFSANEAPPTSDSSSAFFGRWMVLPFVKRYRGESGQDHDLLAKLTTADELSGLLNRALPALERLHATRRFTTSPAIEEAQRRFRVDSDSVAGFLEEACVFSDLHRVPRATMYQSYRLWCELSGRQPSAKQRVNVRIEELGEGRVRPTSSKGVDYWSGIAMRGPA